jgi:hypothetical protein
LTLPDPKNLRTLYLPLFEDLPSLHFRTTAGLTQRRQKRGLLDALASQGPVRCMDYRRVIRRRGRRGFLELLIQEHRTFQPDLVLTQIHGADLLQPEDLSYLRRELPGAVWMNWNGDYQDFGTLSAADIEIVSHFDLQLVVAYDNVADYEKRGIRCRYWQIGWEPDGVGYEPHFLTPRHDVLFLASKSRFYPARQELVARLRRLPVKFGLYGLLWPLWWARGNCLYDYKRGCRLLRAAKLVLADNPRPQARGYVSNRLLQTLVAGGGLMLMQYFHDYETLGLKDGEHLVIWRDFDDLEAKIAYWLRPEQEQERRAMAAAGRELCLEQHSFAVRLQELLGFLAELSGGQP